MQTQPRTPATRRSARCTPPPAHLVMAPVSPAVAQLLHQLQGQLIEEAQARPGVPDGAVVLLPAAFTRQEYTESAGHRVLKCTAAASEIWLQTPCQANSEHSNQRPGLWYGFEERLDDAGRSWSRRLPSHVQDDFGQLVPVGGVQ